MLTDDTFNEVATKSNFYFSIDENKVHKNIGVVNFKAPGNHFRKPNVILPHECVDIQRYVDSKSLTPEKLNEIYAYYSLIIDMHVAQVRPEQFETASYIPPHMNLLDISA